MKSNVYYFIVRDYACIITAELIEILEKENSQNEFHIITMHAYVLDYFNTNGSQNTQVHYMPRLLEEANESTEHCLKLEEFLLDSYGFGINRVYDIERFKPAANAESFILKHVNALFDIITKPGIFLSLSMDHFVFILAGLVNEYHKGGSIFIQPIGFPLKSYILMKNPWVAIPVYNKEQNDALLQAYKDTLNMHPKDSVWYMKEEKVTTNLTQRAKNKIKRTLELSKLKELKKEFTSYSYLDYLYIVENGLHLSEFEGVHTPDSVVSLAELKEKHLGKNKLFFYPLHLEPEMTILAYSPYFQNQLELIQHTSKSLKFGDLLILKENPKSLYRGDAFYKAIDCLPNVKWMSREENSREMIRISTKVIGISGTASIEAACLGINSMGTGFPPFYPLLAQAPITKSALTSFAEELYKEYSKDEINTALEKSWPEYAQSIVQLSLRPESINTVLSSGEIEMPKEKAQDVYSKVLKPCVEFLA